MGADPALDRPANRWRVPRSEVSRLCYLELSLKPIQAPQTTCLMSKESFYFPPLKGPLAEQPALGTRLVRETSLLSGELRWPAGRCCGCC